MSWKLLLLAAFNAGLAWNLYRPVYRHKWGHVLSFALGWLGGELAPFVVGFNVVLVLLILCGYNPRGLVDLLSLLTLAVAWWAMGKYTVASGNASVEMDTALCAALGEDYRERIDPAMSARFPASVLPATLLHPFRLDLPTVLRIRDIPFTEEDGLVIKLDVYHRHDRPANAPVLLQIHGGGWTEKFGSKNEQARPLMNHMADRGWICVSIDYRLSPTATFPAHIIDCKRGLAWVKANIHQYGGNPDFIVVTGGSAGGHLSSLLALSANDPAFQPGFEDVDTGVQGCVPFYGVYDFSDHHGLKQNQALMEWLETTIIKSPRDAAIENYRNWSPMFRAHADAPPFLIIHGACDSLCPAGEARQFAATLAAVASEPVAYAEISGAQHAFDLFRSLRSELVMYGVERYLAFLYSRYLSRAAAR